jgi:hypothetical protein
MNQHLKLLSSLFAQHAFVEGWLFWNFGTTIVSMPMHPQSHNVPKWVLGVLYRLQALPHSTLT